MHSNLKDSARSRDEVRIQKVADITLHDTALHKSRWQIDRFADPDGMIDLLIRTGTLSVKQVKRIFPKRYLGTSIVIGNVCLNTGIQGFEKLLAGLSSPPTTWNAGSAGCGVGDSAATAAATQTNLLSTVNSAFTGMVSGYPSQSGQTLSWQSSFGSSAANFSWNEFVVSNSSAATQSTLNATCLNRLVSSQGTKASGQTWVLTISITWS